MKRRRGEDGGSIDGGSSSGDSPSLYVAPALESTMLLTTGSEATGSDCIGKVDTIPVNASLSSGARLFQYNRFFWNKDLFTFNYSNCCCFVAMAYYLDDGTNAGAYTLFYPIFLPRSALDTLQTLGSQSSTVTTDPAKRKYLIDDLLYYLNGSFTSYNYDTFPAVGPRYVSFPPNYPFQGGPSLYAQSYKGFLQRPTANNPVFPFFQDSFPPPIKFIYASSNSQIALVRNPDFWDSPPPDFPVDADIAFQIISPEQAFFLGNFNSSNRLSSSVAPFLQNNNFLSAGVPSVANGIYSQGGSGSISNSSTPIAEKGWCGQGCYATGFGQSRSLEFPNQYSDIYGGDRPDLRFQLFQTTRFPPYELQYLFPNKQSDWDVYVTTFRLSKTIVLAKKICSLIPSRFFTVESEILTRDQKLLPMSNNPILSSPSIMGVEYYDLDTVRTKVDETLSGRSSKNLDGDTSVVHMNPFYSVQSIDLYMRDEFGNFIQNFRTPEGYTLQFSGAVFDIPTNASSFSGDFVFSGIEGEDGFNNGIFTIPAWLAALNPNTSGGNTQPLIGPFSSYLSQPLYGLFLTAGGIASLQPDANRVKLPSNFSPNMPYSGNFIHFGRVLGY